MRALTVVLAVLPVAQATNPMAKVFELMDECAAKVKADVEAAEKTYNEYFEWCDDTSKNVGFEIKTAKATQEKLEAQIDDLTAKIEESNTKIEKLTASIATDEKELKEATGVREKEAADFAAAEGELVGDIDMLDRAIAVLEKELAKNPAAFAQITANGENIAALVQALGVVVDAAGFSVADKTHLTALVQQRSESDDDDAELGAPAAKVYESKAGGIVDVLADMKDKAESELSDLRKAENNAQHNYNMLKQSLEDQIKADSTDLKQEKNSLAASEEEKATAEGDLGVTKKELKAAQDELAVCQSDCMTVAADHEASVKARAEELAVIAKAKKILQESSGGGVEQTYSFVQVSSKSKKSHVIAIVKELARQHHSTALAQLASRIAAVAKYGNGEDPFAKIKGLITDMIAKLEKEAEEDATEKAYCDEEMGKTEEKKADLEGTVEKLTAKIDKAAATSAELKGAVKRLQKELATLAKEQAEMDQIRSDEHENYLKAKADLEAALDGVNKALEVLRDYYEGAAAFVQEDQPAKPVNHAKKSGAGGSIISILEVCESDFSGALAKEETEEADAAAEYEKITQENKVVKTTKEQDVKYKTQEFKTLDKEITELSTDKDTTATELGAVNEYYDKLKERCVAKPETYEERKKRREDEIAGLKRALDILESETAFVQRKRRGLRGTL
jgi:chromosome segregation ATPase